MLTDAKLALIFKRYLLHHYFIDYTALDLPKGSEHLVAALNFCLQQNADFPNLDLIATHNPDREKDERFLFDLLKKSLQINVDTKELKILYFDEESATTFYQKNIKQNVRTARLGEIHGHNKNQGIIEKYLQKRLNKNEQLTDLDLGQLIFLCGIENCIVTFCNLNNYSEASENIGTSLYFQKEKSLKNVTSSFNNQLSIGLLLEIGSGDSFLSQGIHWVCALLKINLERKKITVHFADSVYSFSKSTIKKILNKAIHFDCAEKNEQGQLVHFEAFPDYQIDFKTSDTIQQLDHWSCGYRAFKFIADKLPDNGNDNLSYIKSLDPHSSKGLLQGFYKVLLTNTQIMQKETRNVIKSVLTIENLPLDYFLSKDTSSASPITENDWENLMEMSISELKKCPSSKRNSRELIINLFSIDEDNTLGKRLNEFVEILKTAEHIKYLKAKKTAFLYLWQPHISTYHQILIKLLSKGEKLLQTYESQQSLKLIKE